MHITRSACNNLFLCQRKSGIFASVSSIVPDAHTCAYLLVDSPSWAHIRCRNSCSVEPAAAISQVLLTVRERQREKITMQSSRVECKLNNCILRLQNAQITLSVCLSGRHDPLEQLYTAEFRIKRVT
jgi:hypothetical protein